MRGGGGILAYLFLIFCDRESYYYMLMKIILFTCLLLCAGICHCQTTDSQQKDIDLVYSRLVKKSLDDSANVQRAKQDMDAMRSDGSWRDIDYINVTFYFDADKHLRRLKNMALAYCIPQSDLFRNKDLKAKIVLGLDFFRKSNPTSQNWWHVDIGAPTGYMVPLLLIKKELGREVLMRLSSYLTDKTDNKAHKGKNRTWVSSILVYKGCIEDNYEWIHKGFASIASTIYIEEADDEGIKRDNSIHQHRPQLYSGGYGMSFMSDLAEYICLADDTSFMKLFTGEKIKTVSDVLLKGTQLFGYREAFDFGTIGRGICQSNCLHNMPIHTLELMKGIDEEHAHDYEAWIKHIHGDAFPAPGNKFFWKSNIMTHHGKNYYLSAKVISVRSNGTEMLNGQNLKGYYLPLGATNIMTTGHEYDDVFVVWDWTRVPGTTGVSNQSTADLCWYFFGSNRFAGGVSDGDNGIIAYEHAYRGIEAQKAYFFLGDAMVCLGSGISAARTQAVHTSVNQCLANGDAFYGVDGKVGRLTGKVSGQAVEWVYHDNVGYIFPERRKNVVAQKTMQTGSWRELEVTASKESISKEVFSVWCSHGTTPQDDTYCYIVMPDKPLSFFQNKDYENEIQIVANTKQLQAVADEAHGWYAAVFYEPGQVVFADGLSVTVDKSVLVCISQKGNNYEVSVADPLYKEETVNLKISREPADKKANLKCGNSSLKINFPNGDYAGSTVTVATDF